MQPLPLRFYQPLSPLYLRSLRVREGWVVAKSCRTLHRYDRPPHRQQHPPSDAPPHHWQAVLCLALSLFVSLCPHHWQAALLAAGKRASGSGGAGEGGEGEGCGSGSGSCSVCVALRLSASLALSLALWNAQTGFGCKSDGVSTSPLSPSCGCGCGCASSGCDCACAAAHRRPSRSQHRHLACPSRPLAFPARPWLLAAVAPQRRAPFSRSRGYPLNGLTRERRTPPAGTVDAGSRMQRCNSSFLTRASRRTHSPRM